MKEIRNPAFLLLALEKDADEFGNREVKESKLSFAKSLDAAVEAAIGLVAKLNFNAVFEVLDFKTLELQARNY